MTIRIPLVKGVQHEMTSYTGIVSAYAICRLAVKPEPKAIQEAQRPYKEPRVRSIAQFVVHDDKGNPGYMPTSIVFGTKKDILTPKRWPGTGEDSQFYYIDIPDKLEDLGEYKDSLDIIDGQHRIFSFLDEYRKIDPSETFELTVTFYITPSLITKETLFVTTNEKQEASSGECMFSHRRHLNLLDNTTAFWYDVTCKLDEEDYSPLKNRIVTKGEVKEMSGALRAKQVVSILSKCKIDGLIDRVEDPAKAKDTWAEIISNYLKAWESAVGYKLSVKNKGYETFSKIGAFRFMMYLLPSFWRVCKKNRQKIANTQFIVEEIRKLASSKGCEPVEIFNSDSKLYAKEAGYPFAGETNIIARAGEWGRTLESLDEEEDDFKVY